MNPDLEALILPGWGDSGPDHWQSIWLQENPRFKRVVQREWTNVNIDDWLATLSAYVKACSSQVVLVGHSMSSILIPHWARRYDCSKIAGVMLVAPTDVERRETCPPETWSFAPIPRHPLPFPSILVAAADDPYIEVGVAEALAQSWGSQFVNIGRAGHINVASGFGPWPEGEKLLRKLCAIAARR